MMQEEILLRRLEGSPIYSTMVYTYYQIPRDIIPMPSNSLSDLTVSSALFVVDVLCGSSGRVFAAAGNLVAAVDSVGSDFVEEKRPVVYGSRDSGARLRGESMKSWYGVHPVLMLSCMRDWSGPKIKEGISWRPEISCWLVL